MLVEFSVTNYRSIGEEQVLSLMPSNKQKDNIFVSGKYEALNALALYGANASGKSNVLKAMEMLDKLLYLSPRSHSTTKLPYNPFLLREGYGNLPTKFKLSFILNEKRYKYWVEYDRDSIISEYLYRKSQGREVLVFGREADVIDVRALRGSGKLIETAIDATKENALFLSVCDVFNVLEAKEIFKWFDSLLFIDGIDTEREGARTVDLWEKSLEYQEKIKNYLFLLNLGLNDLNVTVKDFDENDLPLYLDEVSKNNLKSKLKDSKSYQPFVAHTFYDKQGNPTTQNIVWGLEEESAGSKKAFHLSGPILKTLLEGGVLIIDEIEAKMHPIMTINTINLFLNPITNPQKAQIIFATHDTNILNYCHLRRDQINFVEKNKWQSTEVYALSDFKFFNQETHKHESERIDSDKEKRYLEGRYGAIPILGSFTDKINKWYGEER